MRKFIMFALLTFAACGSPSGRDQCREDCVVYRSYCLEACAQGDQRCIDRCEIYYGLCIEEC